jgi:hypothetical protein
VGLIEALGAGCEVLLTNDDRWPTHVDNLRILQIDDYTD